MTRPRLTLVLCLLLAGCAGPPPPAGPAARPDEQAPRPSLPASFSLEDALAFAWERHPAMRRARARIGAGRGTEWQAALWPRPELEASGALGSEEQEGTLTIAQRLELGGKRRARVDAAAAAVFLAEAEAHRDWVELRAQVKEAFLELAYRRESLAVRERLAALAEETLALEESLWRAGRTAEAPVLAAREEAAAARAAADTAARLAGDARRQVFAACGLVPPAAPGPELRATLGHPLPGAADFARLRALARENDPALAVARVRVAAARAGLVLARAGAWPDLTVGAGLNRPGGEMADDLRPVFRLRLDLPLFDRNQGEIAAAESRWLAAVAAEEAAALDTAAAVSRLFARRAAWEGELAAATERRLPAAARAAALAEAAAGEGKISRREALVAVRTRERLALETLRLRWQAALAAVELEAVAGALAPPAGLNPPASP